MRGKSALFVLGSLTLHGTTVAYCLFVSKTGRCYLEGDFRFTYTSVKNISKSGVGRGTKRETTGSDSSRHSSPIEAAIGIVGSYSPGRLGWSNIKQAVHCVHLT